MTSDQPGFLSFASVPRAIILWVVTVGATVLFLLLGWNLLQIGMLVLPLAAVSIALTAAALRKRGSS